MKTEQKQLDLFSQEHPAKNRTVTQAGEPDASPLEMPEPAAARPRLSAIHCSRCGEWLCDALSGARSYCPRCRIWSGNC